MFLAAPRLASTSIPSPFCELRRCEKHSGDGEMEVSKIKKDKRAGREDNEDDDEWIDEMWGKGWKEKMNETEEKDEREQGVQ